MTLSEASRRRGAAGATRPAAAATSIALGATLALAFSFTGGPAAPQDTTADLDATARDAQALADRFAAAARGARDRAREARLRADATRRRANEDAATLRRLREEFGLPPADGAARERTMEERRARLARERTKHAAAERTPRENKAFYLGRLRATRGLGFQAKGKSSYLFDPGAAPDMADLRIRSNWQWGINVARGSARFAGQPRGAVAKTGHVDYARLDIRPDPASREQMKWGIRRFNMGDVTVRDCDFTDIPREHGIYDEVSGHALYRGNTFKDLGGQALQMAYRDQAFQQYSASNMPYTGRATYVLEDNHAVDTGQNASRSGFVWTFFDPGTHRFPATVVLRGCTSVQEWRQARLPEGPRVGAGHPRAVRSPGGLVVHHYQHVRPKADPATELLVVTNCLFDHTASEMPIAAVRGVETILVHDSCFLARDHRNPVFDVDDEPRMPSGRVVLQNNVSPEGMEVWLHVRGQRVCSMHCPGERVEVDVATREVTRLPMQDDQEVRLLSPLRDRRPRAGVHPQPVGHVDDLGTVRPAYR